MKKETQYCGSFPSWTNSRFSSFIKSALRAASSRWPPSFECLKNAFVGVKENKKTGRQAKHYKCNCCYGEFPSSEVQRDHIIPVIDPFKGFTTWDSVIERMFCSAEGFQILCKPCHAIKTKKEREQRKQLTAGKQKGIIDEE